MAELNRLRKGQTITEHIDIINENVNVVNEDLEKVKDDLGNYVKSVNGEKGEVQLDAVKVGAFPNSTNIRELDIDNIKDTGVYIGTNANKSYYLIVIKYDNGNVYQELIGANSKKYRRFTGTWSEWISAYSSENPVSASDITGINAFDENKEIELALLNDGTFVKTNLTLNPSTQTLKIGNKEFASVEYVDNAVNSIKSMIVSELPETGVENTIYFVPSNAGEDNNFNEWIWVNGDWELIGGASINLTPFLSKQEASETYATKVENDNKVSKNTTINNKPLSSNITLTAEDVGALPIDAKVDGNGVKPLTNSEISTKLSTGEFVVGDTIVVIDDGDYIKGHIYLYNSYKRLEDISKYVDLLTNQEIYGVKNFTGAIQYNGTDINELFASQVNASFSNSISMGRKDATTIGENSVAIGNRNDASGDFSQAYGYQTTASGYLSLADGYKTIASGDISSASGFRTTATHKSQHTFGEYNELDTSTNASTEKGNFIEIVGNGTADDSRSNARTLDWNGNETLSGTLYVKGNKEVATKDEIPSTNDFATKEQLGTQVTYEVIDGKLYIRTK